MSVELELIQAEEKLEVGKATLEIMRGPAWRVIHAAMEKDMKRKLDKLSSYKVSDMIYVARIQGEINELGRFLGTEERLVAEIKALTEQVKALSESKKREDMGASGFGARFSVEDRPDGNPLKGLVPA